MNEQEKLKTLQNILTGCGYKNIKVADYDHTQPDSMDESDSGGFWDLARDVAELALDDLFDDIEIGDNAYQNAFDNMQSLLYNLFCVFKTEQPDD